MGFGSKARKFGNRFLKTTATAGTIARKTGHIVEETGKVSLPVRGLFPLELVMPLR